MMFYTRCYSHIFFKSNFPNFTFEQVKYFLTGEFISELQSTSLSEINYKKIIDSIRIYYDMERLEYILEANDSESSNEENELAELEKELQKCDNVLELANKADPNYSTIAGYHFNITYSNRYDILNIFYDKKLISKETFMREYMAEFTQNEPKNTIPKLSEEEIEEFTLLENGMEESSRTLEANYTYYDIDWTKEAEREKYAQSLFQEIIGIAIDAKGGQIGDYIDVSTLGSNTREYIKIDWNKP